MKPELEKQIKESPKVAKMVLDLCISVQKEVPQAKIIKPKLHGFDLFSQIFGGNPFDKS